MIQFDKVRVGDRLIADDGFTCLKPGCTCMVQSDAEHHLYVDCNEGRHYLSGQLDQNGCLVGFTHRPAG